MATQKEWLAGWWMTHCGIHLAPYSVVIWLVGLDVAQPSSYHSFTHPLK